MVIIKVDEKLVVCKNCGFKFVRKQLTKIRCPMCEGVDV